MKRAAILVNTGRGALVEREALLDALGHTRIAGAGLDVFHDEPLKADDPLLAMPHVVLSPHNDGQTPEVLRDGLLRAVENVENYLAGRPTDVVVAPVTKRKSRPPSTCRSRTGSRCHSRSSRPSRRPRVNVTSLWQVSPWAPLFPCAPGSGFR